MTITSRPEVADGLENFPDLVASTPDSQRVYVELKLYRSAIGLESLVQNTVHQYQRVIAERGEGRAILIITTLLGGKQEVFERSGLEVWDLGNLFQKARKARADKSLTRDLAGFVKRAGLSTPAKESIAGEYEEAAHGAGNAIALQIEACEVGQVGADRFEDLCERALKLLFEKEFAMWEKQRSVEKGFHRIDLIGRLVSKDQNGFWETLSHDFRTRYIVFEFKNYVDPIGQDQIYTTERYLYPTALRAVAIVIARNGVSENAGKAINGALRESGKLIIPLSGAELISLLRGFDKGDDPHNKLVERLDSLLVSIGR
jgi:hypothetical protein